MPRRKIRPGRLYAQSLLEAWRGREKRRESPLGWSMPAWKSAMSTSTKWAGRPERDEHGPGHAEVGQEVAVSVVAGQALLGRKH
jgi:hypothetical protein